MPIGPLYPRQPNDARAPPTKGQMRANHACISLRVAQCFLLIDRSLSRARGSWVPWSSLGEGQAAPLFSLPGPRVYSVCCTWCVVRVSPCMSGFMVMQVSVCILSKMYGEEVQEYMSYKETGNICGQKSIRTCK